MAGQYQPIPEPTTNPDSLRNSTMAVKETVEILTRQRGDKRYSAITWDDLINLGLATPDQVPR